jgi:hypothetical protein
MFGRHVTRHLSAYLQNELSTAERQRVETHLSGCEQCRNAFDETRFGIQLVSRLSKTPAPESLWGAIQSGKPTRVPAKWIPRFAAVGALAALLLGVFWFFNNRGSITTPDGPSWVVENLLGTPRIENAEMQQQGKLRPGEMLQTDSSSKAQVEIATIGRLFVEPDTKLRLVVTKSDEHRISLEHGKIEALTWAPPRLFIVDTPSTKAVDLGCRYTLEVQKDGSSLLHVTLGMVSLENDGRASYVPASFLARTRKGDGPGTPYREDASEHFKAALDVIDFGKDERTRDLQATAVLAEAQDGDAVTLWHLLPRIGSPVRDDIYKRLAAIVPPPPEATHDGILALNSKMLRAWGEAIPQLWWMKESTHENN